MKSPLTKVLALAAGLVSAAPVAAQALPDGVTAATISQGQQLFGSVGICFACHAQDGSGMPGAGPDLTDADWLQVDGSFEEIVQVIVRGVPADEAETGALMPPKGGSQLTDEQVRAVAAYVWSLSNGSD